MSKVNNEVLYPFYENRLFSNFFNIELNIACSFKYVHVIAFLDFNNHTATSSNKYINYG